MKKLIITLVILSSLILNSMAGTIATIPQGYKPPTSAELLIIRKEVNKFKTTNMEAIKKYYYYMIYLDVEQDKKLKGIKDKHKYSKDKFSPKVKKETSDNLSASVRQHKVNTSKIITELKTALKDKKDEDSVKMLEIVGKIERKYEGWK